MMHLLRFVKKNSRQKGFTLLELVVVVALIGIMVPAMAVIFSNILESNHKMRTTVAITEQFDFVLDRVTEDLNALDSLLIADETSIKFATTTTDQFVSLRLNDSSLQLCTVEDCDDTGITPTVEDDFHDLATGVSSIDFNYYDENFQPVSIAQDGLQSSIDAHKETINTIKYIEFVLVLNYLDGTTDIATVVFPENKVALEL
jgi:prepilin-type N-terminal cleavage/methylation domain-containing protein|tara:strand:+ start:1125 stop:1730 length:606 start_codon:yes stop_codon:yes gene_type:complete